MYLWQLFEQMKNLLYRDTQTRKGTTMRCYRRQGHPLCEVQTAHPCEISLTAFSNQFSYPTNANSVIMDAIQQRMHLPATGGGTLYKEAAPIVKLLSAATQATRRGQRQTNQ